MVVSQHRRPRYRPESAITLTIGTPQKVCFPKLGVPFGGPIMNRTKQMDLNYGRHWEPSFSSSADVTPRRKRLENMLRSSRLNLVEVRLKQQA